MPGTTYSVHRKSLCFCLVLDMVGSGSINPNRWLWHQAAILVAPGATNVAAVAEAKFVMACELQLRGGLQGTGSGIRERCACLVLCFVASWSDARLLHLELARSDCGASRLCVRGYLLGRLPPRCSQQACWSVLVFPQSFVSSS